MQILKSNEKPPKTFLLVFCYFQTLEKGEKVESKIKKQSLTSRLVSYACISSGFALMKLYDQVLVLIFQNWLFLSVLRARQKMTYGDIKYESCLRSAYIVDMLGMKYDPGQIGYQSGTGFRNYVALQKTLSLNLFQRHEYLCKQWTFERKRRANRRVL